MCMSINWDFHKIQHGKLVEILTGLSDSCAENLGNQFAISISIPTTSRCNTVHRHLPFIVQREQKHFLIVQQFCFLSVQACSVHYAVWKTKPKTNAGRCHCVFCIYNIHIEMQNQRIIPAKSCIEINLKSEGDSNL